MTVSKTVKTRKKTSSCVAYNEEYPSRLLAFFDIAPFKITEFQKKDGTVSLLETACELPTFEAFAKTLGTTRHMLKKWEEKYPAFAQAADKARDLQSDILIQNSLRGNYSASFAVFTAKNLLGWKDGKDDASAQPQALVVRWEK